MGSKGYPAAQAEETFAAYYSAIDEAEDCIARLNELSEQVDALRADGQQPSHEVADRIEASEVVTGGTWSLGYSKALGSALRVG